MKDRPFLLGSMMVAGGIFGFIGAITGTLAPMLAALFDRGDLTSVTGSSLAFPGIVDFLAGAGGTSSSSITTGSGGSPSTLPSATETPPASGSASESVPAPTTTEPAPSLFPEGTAPFVPQLPTTPVDLPTIPVFAGF